MKKICKIKKEINLCCLCILVSFGLFSCNNFKINATDKFLRGDKMVFYIGHRGSKHSNNCENTKGAYIGGAKAGYHGLETDVRVTKDGVMICFHDNTLTRLTSYNKQKSDLDVNESRFDDIKNINLSQYIDGKKYGSNKICTIDEYLSVCEKYKVIPIIELKWTNGINENDFSNIKELMTKIKEHHLEKTAFIMTSMKKCLEYIRGLDSDIHLQWLCGKTVNDYVDWAIDHKISIDVEYPYCTKELVDKVHASNLYVNVWTLNDESLLETYLNMGVDFITSDYLLR